MARGTRVAQCDVCTLVDGDASPKEVICCGVCSAYLCRGCSKRSVENAARRTRAWAKRVVFGTTPKREC